LQANRTDLMRGNAVRNGVSHRRSAHRNLSRNPRSDDTNRGYFFSLHHPNPTLQQPCPTNTQRKDSKKKMQISTFEDSKAPIPMKRAQPVIPEFKASHWS